MATINLRFLALAFLALAALASCGDNHAASTGVTYPPVPGCEGIDPTPCDVRAPECETRLFALAACLRGDQTNATPPPVTVISETDFGAMLATEAAMSTPDPHRDRWDWALSTVGLIAPGGLSPQAMMTQTVTSILGEYRYKTKDILVIDHGSSFNEQSASPVLVHEMVHALQDREVDLTQYSSTYSGTQDMWLAADSIVEGEARMQETRYRASVLGVDPGQVDWMRRFDNSVAVDQAYVLMQPSPLTASTGTFPYEWGARYVYDTWTAAGMTMASVHGRFLSPPLTTRVLIASIDQALDPEAAPATIAAPVPPDSWMPVDGSTMGAWAVFLMLAKLSPTDAQSIALGWQADGFWIYDGPASQGALVWQIDLADQPTAARMATILLPLFGNGNVRQSGARVVVAKATDGQPLDWAFPAP